MSSVFDDTKTYICARCYQERPLSDTPLKAKGEDTHQIYLYCGDCQTKMKAAVRDE